MLFLFSLFGIAEKNKQLFVNRVESWEKELLFLFSVFFIAAQLDSNFGRVFLQKISSHRHHPGGGETVQSAVMPDAGSYFLKFINCRGQLATNNCQFLRAGVLRKTSEEEERA